MPAKKEFTFSISVSKQTCQRKPDKQNKNSFFQKVRFEPQRLTPQSLLQLALSGYVFCGVFDYAHEFGMPEKPHYVSTSTLFFDIDDADIPMEEYISGLQYKPTVAYTTLRNGIEGCGYRYRLVFVFNAPILGEDGFQSLYAAVGTANQFQHLDSRSCVQVYLGTAASADTFQSGVVYDARTFNDYKPQEPLLEDVKRKCRAVKNSVALNLNDDYLKDFYQMDGSTFIRKYAPQYYKNYQKSVKTPLILDDSQMFYTYPEPYYEVPRKKKGGRTVRWEVGNGRKKKLFYAALIMLKNCPWLTPENLLYNLVSEREWYYSNQDKKLSNEVLVGLITNAFKYDYPLVASKHGLYKVNKPYWADKDISVFTASNKIRYYLKARKVNQLVNPNLSVIENVEVLKRQGVTISERTLRGMVTRGYVEINNDIIPSTPPSYYSENTDNVTISSVTNPVVEQILFLLREDGSRTESELAKILGLHTRTIKRYIKQMNGSLIKREGNNRNGHWAVIESKEPQRLRNTKK